MKENYYPVGDIWQQSQIGQTSTLVALFLPTIDTDTCHVLAVTKLAISKMFRAEQKSTSFSTNHNSLTASQPTWVILPPWRAGNRVIIVPSRIDLVKLYKIFGRKPGFEDLLLSHILHTAQNPQLVSASAQTQDSIELWILKAHSAMARFWVSGPVYSLARDQVTHRWQEFWSRSLCMHLQGPDHCKSTRVAQVGFLPAEFKANSWKTYEILIPLQLFHLDNLLLLKYRVPKIESWS